MISNETKKLINFALLNLELKNPTQETINKATNYLKEAILQIKKDQESQPKEELKNKFDLLYSENKDKIIYGMDLEIPYIAREYYNHTFNINEKVSIGYYIDTDKMDFYEKDIVNLFRITAFVDHIKKSEKIVESGSQIYDFGILSVGEHVLALEAEDIYGRKSFRDYFEIRVKDETVANRYEITLNDLEKYGVKNDYTEDVCEPMTTMLEELSKKYNYLVLPQGIYKTAIDKTIDIPTNTTVDLNGVTIKMEEGKAGDHALQLRILQCEDTHVINGIVQGDYDTHDFANSTNNSEWVHGIDISGRSKYSSFENVEVKDVTGYGITSGFAVDKDGAGYCWGTVGFKTTSKVSKNATTGHLDASCYTDFIDISKFKVDGCNYFQFGKYLGYQGCPSTTWYYTLEMYNENKELVDTFNGYYYRRVYIPQNVRYIKLKNYANSTLALWMENQVSLFAFKAPVNCEIKNCKVDRARCVGFAPNAMESLRLLDTEFTRSGYNGAKCAFDSEDGWDMMHDFYMARCNFHDNPYNDWLTCAGHNFLVENNEYNGNIHFKARTQGMVVRNNKVKHIQQGGSGEGKHYKIYNNEATETITSTKCIIKNCKALAINSYAKNCEIYGLGNSNGHKGVNNKYIFKDGWSGYIANVNIKDSEVGCGTNETYGISFNKLDSDTLFDNVKFIGKYNFNNNNNFNSGLFKNCEIEHIYIDARCQDKPNNSEIVFENCKMTFSNLLMKGSPNAGNQGECHFRFKNCEIIDDGEEYSWRYGKVTDMIYFFSQPVDNSYIIFENCTITKQSGALVGSRTKDAIVKCNIEFNNCTLNGNFKIFGEAVIPEKTNIKVFINGMEQV